MFVYFPHTFVSIRELYANVIQMKGLEALRPGHIHMKIPVPSKEYEEYKARLMWLILDFGI